MNRVNKIVFPSILQRWKARLGSMYAFMGNRDFEEWVVGVEEGSIPPDYDYLTPYITEKERLLIDGRAIKALLDKALDSENYDNAAIYDKILKELTIKYNKL